MRWCNVGWYTFGHARLTSCFFATWTWKRSQKHSFLHFLASCLKRASKNSSLIPLLFLTTCAILIAILIQLQRNVDFSFMRHFIKSTSWNGRFSWHYPQLFECGEKFQSLSAAVLKLYKLCHLGIAYPGNKQQYKLVSFPHYLAKTELIIFQFQN